jgi:hypothetical protein
MTSQPTSCLGGGRGVLGDGLGALRHGVLGQFAGERQADGRLDLAGGQGGLAVVAGELASLGRDALEDVVDEGVHDGHALLGDARLGVHLLQHLVDVRRVGLDALARALLGASGGRLALAALALLEKQGKTKKQVECQDDLIARKRKKKKTSATRRNTTESNEVYLALAARLGGGSNGGGNFGFGFLRHV